MAEVTYYNARNALGRLIDERKNWKPAGANFHERINRIDKQMDFRTQQAVALRAKAHKPVRYWIGAHYQTSVHSTKAQRAMDLLMFRRKKWKRLNTMSRILFEQSLKGK